MKFRLTKLLCAIIFIVFVIEVLSGATQLFGRGVDGEALNRMGAINPWLFSEGAYWRLLAAMFLHIGLLHLLLNSWALYQLGTLFESLFGTPRFAITYFVTGIAASIVSAIRTEGLAAGASGAIFGILGALIVSLWRSPRWKSQPWVKGLIQQLGVWAGINIAIGFSVPGIDNNAHIGGFVAGLLLGLIPHRVPPPPPSAEVIEIGNH
ncbi:MAG: rhomboid family intramembrane serine protease [Longimicrobiales bacterium]